MQEQEIYTLINKYYTTANIRNIKLLQNRIIIEISGITEDNKITSQLKEELNALFPQYKISIIYVEDKISNLGMQEMDKWKIPQVKKIIGIASGKGGVGKSTTAVNLALALAKSGKNVAIVDADIYGPSIPTMLGYENMPMLSADGKHFTPFNNYGVQSVSVGSLINRDTPLIWRGAKACGAIEQLMTQTDWQNVDIMVVDMPPGTGDILITLAQHVDFAGIIIVSTPQDVALIDAVKGVNMFKKTGTPILGIIENMSYFVCPHCGKHIDIFGHEGARTAAQKLQEKFLGSIPLHTNIRAGADKGTPVVATQQDSLYTKIFIDIAAQIIQQL